LLAVDVSSFGDAGSRFRGVGVQLGPKCAKNVRLEKRFAVILR